MLSKQFECPRYDWFQEMSTCNSTYILELKSMINIYSISGPYHKKIVIQCVMPKITRTIVIGWGKQKQNNMITNHSCVKELLCRNILQVINW